LHISANLVKEKFTVLQQTNTILGNLITKPISSSEQEHAMLIELGKCHEQLEDIRKSLSNSDETTFIKCEMQVGKAH
jgi:hypothetical protein